MENIHLIDELALTAAMGVLVAVVLRFLKVPTVAGLLAAGALIGQSGLGWVQRSADINAIAETGVVLLLFTIGMELSPSRLKKIVKLVVLGGSLQVGLTIISVAAVALLAGSALPKAIVLGCIVALSSTAIVLRVLSEKGEIDAPHGRLIVGILIFQDLCVVPMMLLVPVLSGNHTADTTWLGAVWALGKALLLIASTLVMGRLLLPRIFRLVDRTRSSEIFILAVLSVCFLTAWITSQAGLSLALGAFLAGLLLSDTDYSHRAASVIMPLRDALTSIFFITLGMLFDPRLLFSHPEMILAVLFGFTLWKGMVATLAAVVMRIPARVAWLAGMSLAQFGEFGFVLLKVAEKNAIITSLETSVLLTAGTMSMFLTPILKSLAPRYPVGAALLRPLERLIGVRGMSDPEPAHKRLKNHVVIVGYGFAGRVLGKTLVEGNVPYIAIELNADTVRKRRKAGEPVYYGDITGSETLQQACLADARAMVIMINDPSAVKRAVGAVRAIAPDLPILMRTRYLTRAKLLRDLGASDVVVEELEAGIEMTERVAGLCELDSELITSRIVKIREEAAVVTC